MKKRLLLIAPLFFGYYKDIMNEAFKMGYEVDYICDAPSNTNFFKAISRVNRNFVKYFSIKYFNENVIPKISCKQYDNVLIIGGMTFAFTPEMIKKIRLMNKKAVFSLYQWDSEKNLPYVNQIHYFFDNVYTFDRQDAMTRQNVYKFLPLFYNSMYEKIGKKNHIVYDYDCMYVGTAHPKKYYDINEMAQAVKRVYPKQFIYHYMPSRLKFIYHKFQSSEYKHAKYSNFETKKLSQNELINIITKSKCILDAPQAGQTGLTMRTIECLGANRKLITTNKDIVNYDFYKPENIYVYNGTVDFDDVFFKKDYSTLSPQIYAKYSLKHWLEVVLKAN